MPKPNLSQLQKRLMSGFILGALVVGIIIYGGWPFAVMVAIFAAIAMYEWVQLSLKIKNKIPYLVLGVPYVAACFLCLFIIGYYGGWKLSLVYLAIIWSSDTGAYIIGKKFGGPKLAPKISPNKTWAGLIGAILFPVIITVTSEAIYYIFFYVPPTCESLGTICAVYLIPGTYTVLAGLTGLSGQAGDLIISYVKRKADVKDAGNLIPGHGGLLDRVDSMMFVALIFVLFFFINDYIHNTYNVSKIVYF